MRRLVWVGGVLFIAALVATWMAGSAAVSVPRWPVGARPADLPVEDIAVEGEPGIVVRGWVIPNDCRCGVVVLLHGRPAVFLTRPASRRNCGWCPRRCTGTCTCAHRMPIAHAFWGSSNATCARVPRFRRYCHFSARQGIPGNVMSRGVVRVASGDPPGYRSAL